MAGLEIKRRGALLGTEVANVDLSREWPDAGIRELHELWMQHPQLVFPRQSITDAQQTAFARRFGELEIHPAREHRSSQHPEIYRVSNVDEAGNILPSASAGAKYMSLTRLWHSDSSFREVPSNGSILHGIEIVKGAGQTLFCNLTEVYAALDESMQRRIAGLRVVHSHENILTFVDGLKEVAGQKYDHLPPVTHPLVRRHPITGRPSLFISPHTMEGIVGMGERAGPALLDELTAFAIQDRFVYRHEWERDDVIMWDNRCLMHAVMPYDSDRVRRIMHRTTIVGDGPVLQPEDLEIVDAHHHLWDLKNHYPWLGDQPEPDFLLGDYTALKRNYLPEDYRLDAHGLKVVATVHIDAEFDRARPVDETAWLHEIHAQCGMPDAVVAHAYLHADNLEETLCAHEKYPLVRGVRSKPVTSRRPTDPRPDGAGSTHDPNWRRGMRSLERHGLSWDLRVPFWHLEEAALVLQEFHQLKVALNHTGLPWDRSEDGLKAWRAGMRALAALPNVYCKISELGLRHAAWTVQSNRRVVLEAIEIFGIERCMFGSNFPVAGLRVGYRAQVAGLLKILSAFAGSDLHKLFKENALRFYRIK